MSLGIALLAMSFGLDVFAGGLALSVASLPETRWVRTATIFSVVGLALLGLGIGLGRLLSDDFGHFASYLAGVVLIAFGVRGITGALFDNKHETSDSVTLDTSAIISTGIAISLDKLAIGVTVAVSEIAIAPFMVYLAVQSFVVTLLGLYLGKRLGSRFGAAAHVLAGVVFVILGLVILVQTARNRDVF